MNPSQASETLFDFFGREVALYTEFQRIFLKLENVNSGHDPKSLLVTSSTVQEGKSTIASFLAMAMSVFSNKPTLLIDGDMRKPTVSKLFKINPAPGLVELLEGKVSLDQVIQPTPIQNLKVIASGEPTPLADKLLVMSGFKEWLDRLKSIYAITIIDSPPIMILPDALSLNRVVDEVVLVVKAGVTPREVVKRTCNTLRDSGANIIGVVLNNINQSLPYYYNSKYYHYHYDYGKRKKVKDRPGK
jgi:capsular exopolysaccharide synthesis family protein